MSHRITSFHLMGNPEFPRFIIADSRGEVWTGKSWTPEQAEALLYAIPGHVKGDCADLQRAEAANKSHLLTATVPIRIEVFSDHPLDPGIIKAWLHEKMVFSIDFSNGSGPTPDSIVLANLLFGDWTDTTPRPISQKKGKP